MTFPAYGMGSRTRERHREVGGTTASLNSTVRRLAGGVGGQFSTLLLAVTAGFGGYVISYFLAGVLCLLGAGLLVVAVPSARRRTPQRG